jgi:Na+-transporting methylmalonyl-CoA/oxaloacetate decarboxylase gamma subunit
MTEGNGETLTIKGLRTFFMVLTLLAGVVTAYVDISSRVTASESRIETLEAEVDMYRAFPQGIARIEERIEGLRKDLSRIEDRLK